MSFAAPSDPPMRQATKLGAMDTVLVNKFLNHSSIFRSRKP